MGGGGAHHDFMMEGKSAGRAGGDSRYFQGELSQGGEGGGYLCLRATISDDRGEGEGRK